MLDLLILQSNHYVMSILLYTPMMPSPVIPVWHADLVDLADCTTPTSPR
jgi:hypothetical protein